MAAQPGLPLENADQAPDAKATASEGDVTAPAEISQDVDIETNLESPAPEQGQLWDAAPDVPEGISETAPESSETAALPDEAEILIPAEDIDVTPDTVELMTPATETVASVAPSEADPIEVEAVEVGAEPISEPSLDNVAAVEASAETVASVEEIDVESASPWSDEDGADGPAMEEPVITAGAVAPQTPDLIADPETASAPTAALHDATETVEVAMPQVSEPETLAPDAPSFDTIAPDAASTGSTQDPVVFDQGDSPAPVVEALDSDPAVADMTMPEQGAAPLGEPLTEPLSDPENDPLGTAAEAAPAAEDLLSVAPEAADAHPNDQLDNDLADEDEAPSPEDNPLAFADVAATPEPLSDAPMQAAETPEPHVDEPDLTEAAALPEMADVSAVTADALDLDAPALDETMVSDPVMSAPAVSDDLLDAPVTEETPLPEPEPVEPEQSVPEQSVPEPLVPDLDDAADAALPEPSAEPVGEEATDVTAETLELSAPAELGEPMELAEPAELGAPAELTETVPTPAPLPQAGSPEVAEAVAAEETMTAPQSDLPEADLLDVDLPEAGLQETDPPELAPAAAFEMPETAQDIPEQDLSELADVDLTEPAPLEADAHDQNTADTDLGLPDLGTPDLIDPDLVAADPAEAESPVAEEVGESAAAGPKPLVIEIPDEAEPQAPQASGVLARLAGVEHLPADHMAEARACVERLRAHQGAA